MSIPAASGCTISRLISSACIFLANSRLCFRFQRGELLLAPPDGVFAGLPCLLCLPCRASSLFEIAARLGRRNLTISPAGSSRVLFQGQSPPPYSQSPITEATLTLGH